MIDVHCHLEQEDYEKDRENVIAECKKKLKFVVTSCAHFSHLELTLQICKAHKDFVFCTIGLHPEYIKEISKKEKDLFMKKIMENRDFISGIGEVGLDYYWIKERDWREKQKELFLEFIQLAKKLDLPLIVHSRDAVADCIKILEANEMAGRKVLMHLMTDKDFLDRILRNGWFISVGPGILKSKASRKVARDCPLSNLLLETDSPWFGFGERGTPLNVFKVAEKIAEIKKIALEEVEKQTDLNATKFFGLDRIFATT